MMGAAEWARTPGGEILLKCLGAGFIILAVLGGFFGGIAVVASSVGPSWAEICANNGGEVVIDVVDRNIANENHTSNPDDRKIERCEMP